MEEKKLVPKRRFHGFDVEWNRNYLGEIYTFKNGLNKSKEYFGIGTPIVNYTDVSYNRSLRINDIKGKVLINDNEYRSFNVKEGDTFFTRTSETLSEIGYPAVMLEQPSRTVFSGFLIRARSQKEGDLDNLFKRYAFFTRQFRREMMQKSSMTTRALTSGASLSEMIIYYPLTLKEQQKIGKFFKVLDERIANQERKITKVKALKEAYLTEMFPQEGETVPKRRFDGFKGEWELFKLKDIGVFNSNGVDKKLRKNEEEVNLLNYLDVYNRKQLTNDNASTLMQVTANTNQIRNNNVEKNDVFFTPSSETPDDIGRVMVIEETLLNTVYSYHLMRFRPYRDVFYSIFPNYVFDTSYFRSQLELAAQGVQRYVLNRDAFEGLEILLPSLDEQKKITVFLRIIDDQIQTGEAKLKKLKKMKDAYLEEMFV